MKKKAKDASFTISNRTMDVLLIINNSNNNKCVL